MSSTEPRSGLTYNWDLGENNWNVGMDNNLLLIGRFGFHLSAKQRLAVPPTSGRSAGDTYIISATATSDWAAKEGQIAVWDGSAWVYAVPRVGWVCYVEDEEVLSAYKASGWSVGVAI